MLSFKHTFVNFVGAALPMLVIFISVPLYLAAIGADKYGILSLIWVIFGYFGIFDFGVSRAVTSAVSRVKADREKTIEVIWSALALNLVTGVIIALIGGLAYYLFARYSTMPVVADILPSLPLMMLGVPVLMITSTLNGALDGEERFKAANAIQVAGSTLYQLAPLGVAYVFSTKLSYLIDTVIICRIVVVAMYIVVTGRAFRLFDRVVVTMATVRDLLKFGSTVAIINIIDPLLSRIDQIVIARFSGTESVAAYNIAANSIGRLSILPRAMSRAIYPKLATGTVDDFRDELFAMKSRLVVVWFLIAAVAIVATDTLFDLWLHNEIARYVADIGKVYVVGLWANHLSALPYTALQASGRSGSIIKAHMIELPFYLIALVALTYGYGAAGAAAAFGLRTALDHIILWKMCGYPILHQKLFTALFMALFALAMATLAWPVTIKLW